MALDLEDSPRGQALDREWIGEQYPELTALPRWSTKRNLERPTLGPQLGEIASELGTPFMPWQRLVTDVAMELDPDGKLHYRVIVITIHRQGGKTTLILPWEIHRGLAWKRPQRVVYTAQNRISSRQKLVDEQMPLLIDSAFGEMGKKRESNGQEAWIWNNRSQIGLMSNTKRSGHGFTNDLVVLDEAFAQIDWRIDQSLRPTMITRDETQWVTISTAGDETSVYLLEQVRRGRHLVESGEDARVAYFEWSIPLDADMDDPETWKRYLPAVGLTISVDDLAVERQQMTDADFRRAFGNQWTEGMGSIDSVIPQVDWQAMSDRVSTLSTAPMLRLAVDVAPDQSTTSLAVAGIRSDGREHVEVIETFDGTAGVAERIRAIVAKDERFGNSVSIDLSTPAASFVPALEQPVDIDTPGVTIDDISGRDWNAACALLLEDAKQQAFVHIDDPELNKAVLSAGQSKSTNGWHWNRRGADPITPLCAVTLAHWAIARAVEDNYDPLASFY